MAKNPWNSKAPASPFPTAKSEKRKNTWEACANREKAIQAGRSHVCLSLTYDGLPRIVRDSSRWNNSQRSPSDASLSGRWSVELQHHR